MITGFLKYIDDTSKEVNMDGLDTFHYLLQNNLSKIKSNLEDHDPGWVIIKRQGFADGRFNLKLGKKYEPIEAREELYRKFRLQRIKEIEKKKKERLFELLESFSNTQICN